MYLLFLLSYNDKYRQLFPGSAKGENGLTGCTSMLTERAGQFYKARCKMTKQLRTGDVIIGLKDG